MTSERYEDQTPAMSTAQDERDVATPDAPATTEAKIISLDAWKQKTLDGVEGIEPPDADEGDTKGAETDSSEQETAEYRDLDVARNLILAAYPDAVPELIQGQSLDEMLGSVEVARAAYKRVAETIGAETTATAARPSPAISQPAGRQIGMVIDQERLSPLAKISHGLRRVHD